MEIGSLKTIFSKDFKLAGNFKINTETKPKITVSFPKNQKKLKEMTSVKMKEVSDLPENYRELQVALT